MTIVCNLFGGPGTGKSTNATYIFSELKRKGIICEYVSEYAKDITWEETHSLLNNQIHIFSEQFRRQMRLIDKVDVIITDSPLLLGLIYYNHYAINNSIFSIQFDNSIRSFILCGFLEFDNVNYFLTRTKDYVEIGRNQTEQEAKQLDSEIKDALSFYRIEYETRGTEKWDADEIVNDIIERMDDK